MYKLDSASARYLTIAGVQYLAVDDMNNDTHVRVAEVLPSLQDPQSIAAAKKITDLDPTFVDGDYRGYYVPLEKLGTPVEHPVAVAE